MQVTEEQAALFAWLLLIAIVLLLSSLPLVLVGVAGWWVLPTVAIAMLAAMWGLCLDLVKGW